MKVLIKNLGAIKQAEFSLGDLTIICGKNNTGKTYAAYALFGFLTFWRRAFSVDIAEEIVLKLLNEGSVELDIDKYVAEAELILDKGCASFSTNLADIFASSEKHFVDSYFEVKIKKEDIQTAIAFQQTMGAAKTQLFSITKKENSSLLNVSLLVEKEDVKIPQYVIGRTIGNALKEIMFGRLFPNPFIASTERTGAAIFRKELNFARNRLLEEMGAMENNIDPLELLSKVYTDYALPVRSNVDFTRRLEEFSNKESFIQKNHPEILVDFGDIIGGDYHVNRNDELYFIPQGKRIKLTMDESSSAVRSLLDIAFYLRHVAKPGDLLIIDEPELNLHPENQRRIARLITRLLNIGIKVFITTHSDYIIKELNTLIMLNQDEKHLKELAARENYKSSELLNASQVKVYVAEEALVQLEGRQRRIRCHTLVPADIDDKLGIEAHCFDKTIEEMNRIQAEIVWGE